MEGCSYGDGGSRLVVTELSHIRDLVMELETHLDGSHGFCKHLTSQIFSLTERSIGMISSSSAGLLRKRAWGDAGLASGTPIPLGDDVVPFKSTTRKRKTVMRKVRVKALDGGKEPVDDGHSWRKYGQKPILGAIYPRSYYRCRHRHTQGCKALKKMQRVDEDPTLFDVMYYGTHTCVERMVAAPAPEHHLMMDAQLMSGGLITVKTDEEGLVAATTTEPQDWNAVTAPALCPASSSSPVSWCLSPAISDMADEFLDFDVISSFF